MSVLLSAGIVLSTAAVLASLLVRLTRGRPSQTRILMRTGSGIVAGYVTIIGLVSAGELLTHPGGGRAVETMAVLLAPLVALGAVARSASPRAPAALGAVVAGVVALATGGMGYIASPSGGWLVVLVGVGMWAACGGLAVLGLRRPRPAGILLITVGLAPPVLSAWRDDGGTRIATVLTLLALPLVLGGLTLLRSRSGRPVVVAEGRATIA